MKYCLYYWLVDPLRGGITDSPSRIPTLSIPFSRDGRTYDLSLFCDERNFPQIVRCRIPDLSDEQIPKEVLPVLQTLKEHLLSTLRLTFRHDISLWHTAAWSFFDNGTPHDVRLEVTMLGEPQFDAEKARNLFISSFPFREDIRLLVDGTDSRVPLQYRVLSLYKLLETYFKTKGQWDKKAFDSFLSRFRTDFEALGFQGHPSSTIHAIRNMCAHIKTGTRKERFGVTHLNHSEAVRAERALKVLKKVCSALLSEKAGGAFTVEPAAAPTAIKMPHK